jgi:hypothetical protein
MTRVLYLIVALTGHQLRVALIVLKAHAFWPEAISIAACPVTQYLGLKLGLQIDHSLVPPIPNIEPQAALQAYNSDIASGQNAWAFYTMTAIQSRCPFTANKGSET